ncbi:hypothetical protein K4L44_08475 [Halosquirtibacter laminarini]|uniref:Uncharacterized protein n=1 Tax=Halosquirtibacter laminarini TaxID=3374600 RepID=A0AC61NJE7_9BACT|nr:hypothetical protein K4L44_08475 [Prolixibacteraceae bacterium]
MIRSILYKEEIKTRRIAIATFIAMALLATYILINIFHTIRYQGEVTLWDMIVHKDYNMISDYKYVPLLVGILWSLFQMIPELQRKRLKLTLHLPIKRQKMIAVMIGYGLTMLTMLFILTIGIPLLILSNYFSYEIIWAWSLAILPWIGAGYLGYLAFAAICIEPTWRNRVVLFLLFALSTQLFLFDAYSKAMIYMYPIHLFILLLFGISIFYTTIRFKEGRQG